MLRTIDRYIIRETIPPFLLSLVIFTFLLEIPPVMRDLEMLVAKGVSWPVAGRIVLTLIPQALGLTIPMALLTGLLIGLGRLSSDRETVALLACGVSPHRLLRPVLLMATVAAGATLYVMVKALPDANQTFREITFDVIAKQVENDVRPRVSFENFPGWVLYARDEPEDRVGWKDTSLLAAACNITLQSVRRHLRDPPNEKRLAAAALCLGDERLRICQTHIIPRQTFLKATKRAG